MKTLTCRLCGATLNADQLDRRLAIITCSHCGGIYDLTRKRLDEEIITDEDTDVLTLTERAPAPLPDYFKVERGANDFSISWRWFDVSNLLVVFVAAAWIGFLVLFYLAAGGIPTIMIGHIVVGFIVGYIALAIVLNTTRIDVNAKTVKIRHFPLLWYPAPTLDSDDIEQIYVVEKYTDDKEGHRHFHYNLNAVLRDNRKKKLLTRLPSVDQGLYLEQEFETFMGIRDRQVAGEVTSKSFRI